MLERVPASAESAAHLFLRNFERPCRSHRVLDPRFWRHAASDSNTPNWWPLYLQQIRQVPHTRHTCHDDPSVAPTTSAAWSASSNVGRRKAKHHLGSSIRSYTVSATRLRAQAPQKIYDVFGLDEETPPDDDHEESSQEQRVRGMRSDGDEDEDKFQSFDTFTEDGAESGTQKTRNRAGQRHSLPKSQHLPLVRENGSSAQQHLHFDVPSPLTSLAASTFDRVTTSSGESGSLAQDSQLSVKARRKKQHAQYLESADPVRKRLSVLLMSKHEPTEQDLNNAWRFFIALDDQEIVARHVFRYLAQSQGERHMARALEAFRLVPRTQRRAWHYKTAIKLELQRGQYRVATNLAFEATIRGFDALPDLMAYFVQNLLWSHAAELLHRNTTARRDMAAFTPLGEDYSSPRMLPISKLMERCSSIPELHLKVLSLAERLQSVNFALLEYNEWLGILFRRLAQACAESSTAMKSISPSALLAFLGLQRMLPDLKLHDEVLNTIVHLNVRPSKCDLALMVYRNYRSSYPDGVVPPWYLGSLIALCSETNYSLDIYDYLLDEFERLHGRPDFLAYQRVLTACARQGNLSSVERHLTAYFNHHTDPPTLALLSPLIYACAVNGDNEGARAQFNRIKNVYGLEPNNTCWNMLILAHARSIDDLSAFDVFAEMVKLNKPDTYTYGTLMGVCAAHADLDAALQLLSDARDAQVTISVPIVNTIVEIYLSNHEVGAAVRFATATSRTGTRESLTRLWNSIARYCAIRGDIDGCLKVRKQMARYKVEADEMTYAALVTALISMKKTSEAVKILREMHQYQELAVTPLHYALVLNGFVREHNRDMVVVIAKEMARRFPHMNPTANRALLLLRKKSLVITGDQDDSATNLIVSLLEDLYQPASASHATAQGLGQLPNSSTVASMYFDTVFESMLQNGSFDAAARLLQHLEDMASKNPRGTSMLSGGTMRLSLARMDLAIARADHASLDHIWQSLFERASQASRPISSLHIQQTTTSHDTKHSHSNRQTMPTPVLKAWQTSLSKPLNKYMDGMARQGRINEVVRFLKRQFWPAGFKLTGVNWNKYVQVLSLSRSAVHHVTAFQIVERKMLNRAQNWTLLKRGLLRQKSTRWYLLKHPAHERPVLRKKTVYSIAKRTDVMRRDPRRIVPTYTTMVHLASALLLAERHASSGTTRGLREIAFYAPRAKRLVQQMPYLKDHLQSELIRNGESRMDQPPQPKSERSLRLKTDSAGILDSPSLLDQLPAEFLRDIEDIVAPRNEPLRLLLGTHQLLDKSPRNEKRDISLGEQLFGQIPRDPMILPGDSRHETEERRVKRIREAEHDLLAKMHSIRRDLDQRRLIGQSPDAEFESPVGRPVDQADEARISRYTEKLPEPIISQNTWSAEQFKSLFKPKQIQKGETGMARQELRAGQSIAQLEPPYKGTIASTSLLTRPRPSRAIPYLERRRVRRLKALKQRHAARRYVESIGVENLSDRAIMPRTAAARRLLRYEQALSRRRAYLQYEAEVRAGKRALPPLRTYRGFWRRLLRQGYLAPVRFVADLGRPKIRNLLHRGFQFAERPTPRNAQKIKMKDDKARRRPALPKKKAIFAHRRAQMGLPPREMLTKMPDAETKEITHAENDQLGRMGYQPYHPLMRPPEQIGTTKEDDDAKNRKSPMSKKSRAKRKGDI